MLYRPLISPTQRAAAEGHRKRMNAPGVAVVAPVAAPLIAAPAQEPFLGLGAEKKIERIRQIVLDDLTGVSVLELCQSQAHPVVRARRVGIYLALRLVPEGKRELIMSSFGMRDRRIALRAKRFVEASMQDQAERTRIEGLERRILES